MTLAHKKSIFVELGKFLSQFSEAENTKCQTVLHNDLYFDKFIDLIQLSPSHSPYWFPSTAPMSRELSAVEPYLQVPSSP